METAQSAVRSPAPYQVIREYRLFSANSTSAVANVVAEVDFRPPNSKSYNIQSWSGSGRGQQVVRRILDHEIEAATQSDLPRAAAVTSSNYDFTYIGEAVRDGQPCYLLGLKPKRREEDLVSGEAWVDKQTFLVRHIEGEVAKTPSWWPKKIRVELAFGNIEGNWLQTSMEAVADVRILGPHTLTSRLLHYRSTDVVASTTLGPTRLRTGDHRH
jgi:hypothetical protein